MSTFALAIGLVVGNLIKPGASLHLTQTIAKSGQKALGGEATTTTDFVLGLIPRTLFSALTEGSVLQALIVALLVGFALQMMGRQGEPILAGIKHLERLVFRVMAMVMWVAPVGAFGAIAAITGQKGFDALKSLGIMMLAFYLTCAIFVFLILGTILLVVTGVNVFSLFRYLAREFLLILSTSSSESALPRLIAKMEHLGIERSTVGIPPELAKGRDELCAGDDRLPLGQAGSDSLRRTIPICRDRPSSRSPSRRGPAPPQRSQRRPRGYRPACAVLATRARTRDSRPQLAARRRIRRRGQVPWCPGYPLGHVTAPHGRRPIGVHALGATEPRRMPIGLRQAAYDVAKRVT